MLALERGIGNQADHRVEEDAEMVDADQIEERIAHVGSGRLPVDEDYTALKN